ncbi:TPA: LapB repeat-containing protein [Listeria innocua]|uniref:LapB repeat-containing protein n=1 Tax=Listeria innocua TaxID=1642 RepID=UPI0010D6005B|nr:LapB repeat-containing protein [Listeria innocua]MBC2144791.1 LapB repeat-containing protein [Listeria innocua]HBM4072749.1 LapB repeat-containing protein [Listeria innocua]
MKQNWKPLLLFILLLALCSPVYSFAEETREALAPKTTETPELTKTNDNLNKTILTPEKKQANNNSETKNKTKESQTNKKAQTPLKNLKNTLPPNSKISDIFKDPGMANAVAVNLTKYTSNNYSVNSIVTEDELKNLRMLAYNNRYEPKAGSPNNPTIKSIEGIQYLTGVDTIDLNSNDIKDLSPFLKAPNGFPLLDSLFLGNNDISDVSVIPKINMPFIWNIRLGGNKVTDVSSLKNLADNSKPRLQIIDVENQRIVFPKKIISSKKSFSLTHKTILMGTSGTVPIMFYRPNASFNAATSTITWSKEEMLKKPTIRVWDKKSSTSKSIQGVEYVWQPENISFGRIVSESSGFTGIFQQPLEYLGPPKIISSKDVVYEVNTPLTESKFLEDAKIVTDQETTITTNFNSKIKDTSVAGVHFVTVTASNIEGEVSIGIKVVIKNKQPVITAKSEYTYLVGENVDSNQFRQDINATLTGPGSIPNDLKDDFASKVDLNKVGDYFVELSTPDWPPLTDAAKPVTILVRVREGLEMKISDDFRMDVDENTDPIPISNNKQTLKCFAQAGDAEIEVLDRRRAKQGWTITGMMSPFKNEKGDILETSLKYQKESSESSPIFLNATNQPIEIKQPTDQSGEITTTFNLQNNLTLEVLPNDALVTGIYEATVTWTLEDVPR